MRPPRLDALEVIFVGVARPPCDGREMTGELDDMLTGTAAGLHDIAGFPGKKPLQNVTDGPMVAMKGRCVEPPVRLPAAPVLAKFHDIVGHVSLRCAAPRALSGDSVCAWNDYIPASPSRELRIDRPASTETPPDAGRSC